MDDISTEDHEFDKIFNVKRSPHIATGDWRWGAKSSGRCEGPIYHKATLDNHDIVLESMHWFLLPLKNLSYKGIGFVAIRHNLSFKVHNICYNNEVLQDAFHRFALESGFKYKVL